MPGTNRLRGQLTSLNTLATCGGGGLGSGRRVAKWLADHPDSVCLPASLPFGYVSPAPNNSGSNYYLSMIATQTNLPRSVSWSPNNAIPFSVLYTGRYPIVSGGSNIPIPPPVTEASLHFNGVSSYLSIEPPITSINLQDFTVEGWFQLNTNNNSSCGFVGAATTTNGFSIRIESDSVRLDFLGNTNKLFNFSTFTLGQWYYLTVVRQSISGTQNYMVFINGIPSSTTSQTIQSTIGGSYNIDVTSIDLVGAWNTNTIITSFLFDGNISSIRIVLGALYSINGSIASFTPPNFPLPIVSNTLFLLQTTLQNPFAVLPSGTITNNGGVVASPSAPS